ncbi:MAG: ABC transporter substrate-binding protein, partial [Gammaproteobacteria bacterium]|nr:ABC transporter substrate-binding protein [Gammaproteobacteria bacterium]
MSYRDHSWSRREFLHGLGIAGAIGATGLSRLAIADPALETTRLRLTTQKKGLCVAPKYVAEELLKVEGFTDIQYANVENLPERMKLLASGETDLEVTYISPYISRIDVDDPIVIIGGAHVGCFELFGTESIRNISDLKGKTIAVSDIGNPDHAFLASILLYIGLDPNKDVQWVTHPPPESIQLLAAEEIDAFLGFPPVPQALRANEIGHTLLNSSTDRPWSQYFCCMVATNTAFMEKNPVATKKALRAILKAADICAREPALAAQLLMDMGLSKRYDYVIQTMQEVPYV